MNNKNKGFSFESFDKAASRANQTIKDPAIKKFSTGMDYFNAKGYNDNDKNKNDYWPRNPGSADNGDPYDIERKPEGVPVWDHPPATPEEEAIYYGSHLHSEHNPLGGHSHIKGGTPSGYHRHSPGSRFGGHHHRKEPIENMVHLDGNHCHKGHSFPDGPHEHSPENLG